ncbi:MAG: F0F1 ATP synthase subunit B [Cyanobacteria bacterium P01_A01_bin.80]
MGTFLLLAASAAAGELAETAGESGFGINTDILDTNIINLAIIITVLIVFGRKALGGKLEERRLKIETAIKNAEQRASEAQKAIAEQQQKLAQAQTEAQSIREAASENAKKAKEAILAEAATDVERMKQTAAADMSTERDKAIAQLRERVVASALEKAESELRTNVADDAQHTLVDRSIALMGG